VSWASAVPLLSLVAFTVSAASFSVALVAIAHVMWVFAPQLRSSRTNPKFVAVTLFFLAVVIAAIATLGPHGYWLHTARDTHARLVGLSSTRGSTSSALLATAARIAHQLRASALASARGHALAVMSVSLLGLLVAVFAFDDAEDAVAACVPAEVQQARNREVCGDDGRGARMGDWRRAGWAGFLAVSRVWDVWGAWGDVVQMRIGKTSTMAGDGADDAPEAADDSLLAEDVESEQEACSGGRDARWGGSWVSDVMREAEAEARVEEEASVSPRLSNGWSNGSGDAWEVVPAAVVVGDHGSVNDINGDFS
jgi:hypothetical protein